MLLEGVETFLSGFSHTERVVRSSGRSLYRSIPSFVFLWFFLFVCSFVGPFFFIRIFPLSVKCILVNNFRSTDENTIVSGSCFLFYFPGKLMALVLS